MDETQAPVIPQSGIETTALGRLQMRVPDDDGYDDVVVERRWPDMAAARAWCERTVLRASIETAILEIQGPCGVENSHLRQATTCCPWA